MLNNDFNFCIATGVIPCVEYKIQRSLMKPHANTQNTNKIHKNKKNNNNNDNDNNNNNNNNNNSKYQ